MVKLSWAFIFAMGALFVTAVAANAEQTGSIRGKVSDKDLDTPLVGVQVLIVERNLKATTMEQGNFVINEVPPGKYTLVFTKDGYARQSKGDVTVAAGEMTDVDLSLVGDVTEMEEFVCQDTKISAGSETELLTLRADSAALITGIGSEQIKRAAASDAASALKLVSGASVQDDKYAVIRGLPDRYISSQMNGVRLPTADVDKRAVQLDQFPAAIIERLEVTKTFTPDQQGDATGGAVNVVLKGIPEENMFKFDLGTGIDTQTASKNNFLTSKGGSPNWLAWKDRSSSGKFSGPVGVSYDDSPMEYNWSMTAGGKKVLPSGWKIGGMASLFYKRNNYFDDDGVNDSLWVLKPGAKLTPRYSQGAPEQGDFKTSLFDVTRGNEEVKWGGMSAAGIENKNNMVRILYLYTRSANNYTTLAEDTRGKQYYFPDYRVDDPLHPGNQARDAAPYLRTETLDYVERTTQTLQLSGKHTLPVSEFRAGNVIKFLQPTIDWTGALSDATMNQPDKRQFGSLWWAQSYNAGQQAFYPSEFRPYKPAANSTVGNLQRVWRDITEDSGQYFVNLKYPFEQWSGDKGYFKFGVFNDYVTRHYNQDSYSNFGDNSSGYQAPFENFWNNVWLRENHPMSASNIDVDYRGKQNISAWYYMADIPTCNYVNVIGGVRYETTKLSIVNKPEKDVSWYPKGGNVPWKLYPGDADVTYNQNDALPSIGLVVKPVKKIKIQGVYSETVARQTFKELTPIQQQEFLGGDVFIGNPSLKMSAIKNYDLRMDYTPTDDQLYSVGVFYKDIKDPIEYVQKLADFLYTTPTNYPKGTISGLEFEARQKMGNINKALKGLTLGGNATFINSEVTLPDDEAAKFNMPNIKVPMSKRNMTGAPSYLYNIYTTYDIDSRGTQLALFYTVKGDTLVAGAGQSNGHFVPNVYEKEYGTLNFTASQKLTKNLKLIFQAKNLLDPAIQTIYRTDSEDATRTSYHKGTEFWLYLSAEF